ncbi:MAG: DUF2497 domain-containing protein [Alphaproteobacteria bacterium]
MSDPKAAPQAEPSMEEILASIRRIISEEGSEAEPAKDASADAADDVLELTEVVEDTPLPVVEPAPAKRAAAPPAAVSQDDIDAIMNGAFDAAPEPEPEIAPEPEPEPFAAFEPEAAPEPEPQPARPAPVLRAVEDARPIPEVHRLVSDAAAVAASAAFAGLAGVRRQQPADGWPIGAGHTVEDLVRELMRPMLKEWLDANLPSIVDRLVRQEIERIARNADAA